MSVQGGRRRNSGDPFQKIKQNAFKEMLKWHFVFQNLEDAEANLNREKKLMELQTDMNIGNNEKMELMKAIHNEDDFLEAKAAISGGAQMTPAPKQRADSGSKGKISPPTTKSNRGQKQQRSSARTVGGKGSEIDRLIGLKVKRWWGPHGPNPADWYAGYIVHYDPESQQHHICYDINTEEESYEIARLDQLSPDEVQITNEKLDPQSMQLWAQNQEEQDDGGLKMPSRMGKGQSLNFDLNDLEHQVAKGNLPPKKLEELRGRIEGHLQAVEREIEKAT